MVVKRRSIWAQISSWAPAALLFAAALIVPAPAARAGAAEGSKAGEAGQGATPVAHGEALVAPPPQTQTGTPSDQEIQVPPPPLQLGLSPCSQCHADMTPNLQPRALSDPHDGMALKHGKERWCLDCHDAKDRDHLHLVNGQLVDFEQSYKLCGQCHGDKYRDWKVGVHGKRTGHWNGQKQYLLCVNCHDPHQPRFKPLQPLPPPVPPEQIAPAGGAPR